MTSPKKNDPFEAELDAIRLAFYEETKSMSPMERNAYIRAQVAPLEKQFNIQPVSLPVVRHPARQQGHTVGM